MKVSYDPDGGIITKLVCSIVPAEGDPPDVLHEFANSSFCVESTQTNVIEFPDSQFENGSSELAGKASANPLCADGGGGSATATSRSRRFASVAAGGGAPAECKKRSTSKVGRGAWRGRAEVAVAGSCKRTGWSLPFVAPAVHQ